MPLGSMRVMRAYACFPNDGKNGPSLLLPAKADARVDDGGGRCTGSPASFDRLSGRSQSWTKEATRGPAARMRGRAASWLFEPGRASGKPGSLPLVLVAANRGRIPRPAPTSPPLVQAWVSRGRHNLPALSLGASV